MVHGYHVVEVARVIPETTDAATFVVDAPFTYDAGQFLTFRLHIDGAPHVRCYSMSSAPAVDAELRVTVKRVPGGVVSNWMIDALRAGDVVEAQAPAGFFRLTDGDGDLVLFAAGSGITPVFSLLKTALATTDRRVRLLYANRDRDSVIFAGELDALVEKYGERLDVVHRLDVEHGYVDADTVAPFAADGNGEFYVCGPTPFMDVVEHALLAGGADAGRIHIERFTPADEIADPVAADPASVTIELGGKSGTTSHRAGSTILQTARELGMSPPFSCESGSCATCMARLVEGEVSMRVNNALLPDEVDEGWILTCQSVPTSPSVHVVYE
jgi:3-ketosteroid 9alpha-monooxygenase subunit B